MRIDLETAAHQTGMRRVAIDPVSRVEGHGKVTILLDADNRVHQVRLHIVEFRERVPDRGQPLGARALQVAEVVGVIDDPGGVGVLVVHAHREGEARRQGRGARAC